MSGLRIADPCPAGAGSTPADPSVLRGIASCQLAERTAGGYRSYDDEALARLAFIARAKQLGCTLDEISDLSIAWDGGRCGPVQDRLRDLVAAKLADAQARIAELVTVSAELQRARQRWNGTGPRVPATTSAAAPRTPPRRSPWCRS